uniref:Uncharacterized protein n=1 Tax=Palpitomonas bilix TaxID=652834 RepID=A0A7S3D1D2_9EUKA|mmetsp:Transcript_18267/g.45691  ORF Transcript_18267/g.45691 Transcript_18267/m.45691 type:complete len:112 (+) Transcript_18267:131-466(+)
MEGKIAFNSEPVDVMRNGLGHFAVNELQEQHPLVKFLKNGVRGNVRLQIEKEMIRRPAIPGLTKKDISEEIIAGDHVRFGFEDYIGSVDDLEDPVDFHRYMEKNVLKMRVK